MLYGARKIPERERDQLLVVAHSDFDDANLDLEIGFSLSGDWDRAVTLPSRAALTRAELPDVECMATLVRSDQAAEILCLSGVAGRRRSAACRRYADAGRIAIVSNLINYQYLGLAIDGAKYPHLARYTRAVLMQPVFRRALEDEKPFAEQTGLDRSFV